VNMLVSWADELRELLAQNKVAALVVRGVDVNGDLIAWGIAPDNDPKLRYIQIGQLHEAISELIALDAVAPPEPDETVS